MNIRRAITSDIQDIAALHVESWKNVYADVLPAEFMAGKIDRVLMQHWREIDIRNEDIVLVAEEDSLLGFIAVWCRPVPYIDNLHVRPSHRSKNVGSALMKAAAKELMGKKQKTAYLWVFESNQKAIRFYTRLGGIQKEQAWKDIFGYEVLSRKIEWNDLSRISASL